jgi:HAD superfamily hydrolase (TIGR01662 family)
VEELQAVFVDRDGTIGGTGHFIHPKDFRLFPNVKESIDLLKKSGIKVFAFTNQHRIARGEAKIEEFEEQFHSYGFDQAYICPHRSEDNCHCRKPKPGMLYQAAREHNLNLHLCAVIGDGGDTDMLAAESVGGIKVLVRTGWGEGALGRFRSTWASVEPDYIASDFSDATRWLIKSTFKEGGNIT